MPRRARTISNSGYYHVVMRGIGKQILFEERADYLRFLETLERYLSEEPFDVLAYCLMENHVHLLLHTQSGLERIMKRIAGSYAYYFNNKYERSGHLFQDRFSSEPIDSDSFWQLCGISIIIRRKQESAPERTIHGAVGSHTWVRRGLFRPGLF